jgi:hypothetical protein
VLMGMSLWSQVIMTTVLLTENYRARNPQYQEAMERLRRGALTPADIERIKSRVFGHPNGPDPTDPKWQDSHHTSQHYPSSLEQSSCNSIRDA